MTKTIRYIVIALLVVIILAMSFGIGYSLGIRTPSGQDEGLESVEQAWNIIFKDYVDKDRLDTSKMSQAAIEGMLEALDDPYSSYLDPETQKLGLSTLEGEFEGIGAHVGIRDEQLTIIAPIPDSPADKAGIKAGDEILAIDGESTAEMSLAEAVLKIRGTEGIPVKLRVFHHQSETIKAYEAIEEIEIVRAKIELPSVFFEMKDDIAYVHISYFSGRTNEELSPVMEDINKEANGIILDLRRNSGGVLPVVVDVASRFLEEGTIVSVVDSEGNQAVLEANPGEMTTALPIVVLVDNYTASGGEVLAGALQDYRRATIAGSKTFGKGSVNILRPLEDGSGLYITTARWLTPKGRLIEGEGIEPDYELEDEDAIQWAMDCLKGSK